MRRALVGVVTVGLLLGLSQLSAGASAESIASVRQQVDAIRQQLEQASAQLDAANNAVEDVEQRLAFDQLQLKDARAQLQLVQQQLAGQVSTLYRDGGLAMLDALLSQDAARVPDRLEFVDMIVGRRADLVADIRTASSSYETIARQLEQDHAEAIELAQTAKKSMGSLTAKLKQEQLLLNRLAGFKGGRASYPPPILTVNGRKIACPVEPPYTFTDTYGAPRSGGRTHKGVDIIAPYGAREFAYESGTMRKDQNSLGGLTLYLEGDSGIEYYYAHLSRYAFPAATKRVQVGELVGYVGNTGDARYTVAHLHFEVHPVGHTPVDPTPYATRACG